MAKSKLVIGVGLVIMLSGCVPSLHPLYTEQDVIFNPALLGEWAEENAKDKWVFTKGGEKGYKLVYIDKDGTKGEFEVHLLKFKDRIFMDLFPKIPDLEENVFYKIHLLPVHTFMFVKQIEPTLQIAFLDPEWLSKFLKEHPHALRHERLDGEVFLTAQPKELQAFLIKHERTKEAFGGLSNMKRKASAGEEESMQGVQKN